MEFSRCPLRRALTVPVDLAFGRVREVVDELVETREIGAWVAVWVDGREVADLSGGFAGPTRTGMTAIVAHRLVDRGVLDLGAPVARGIAHFIPEFAGIEGSGPSCGWRGPAGCGSGCG